MSMVTRQRYFAVLDYYFLVHLSFNYLLSRCLFAREVYFEGTKTGEFVVGLVSRGFVIVLRLGDWRLNLDRILIGRFRA